MRLPCVCHAFAMCLPCICHAIAMRVPCICHAFTMRLPCVCHAPCGNFFDTSSWSHAFAVCIRTENQNQASFSPFGPHEISVLIELTLGHLRYLLTDVPPQPNSPPDYVFRTDQRVHEVHILMPKPAINCGSQFNGISKMTSKVVVFHSCVSSHLFYTSQVISQSRTRVKLNRVFRSWGPESTGRTWGFT